MTFESCWSLHFALSHCMGKCTKKFPLVILFAFSYHHFSHRYMGSIIILKRISEGHKSQILKESMISKILTKEKKLSDYLT